MTPKSNRCKILGRLYGRNPGKQAAQVNLIVEPERDIRGIYVIDTEGLQPVIGLNHEFRRSTHTG